MDLKQKFKANMKQILDADETILFFLHCETALIEVVKDLKE